MTEHRPSKRIRIDDTESPEESLVPLTPRDRNKAFDLLKEIGKSDPPDMEELEQVAELQKMLMLNTKAEIQAVDNQGDIKAWLDRRLCQELSIE